MRTDDFHIPAVAASAEAAKSKAAQIGRDQAQPMAQLAPSKRCAHTPSNLMGQCMR